MYRISLDEAQYRLTQLWADRKVQQKYSISLQEMLTAQVMRNVARTGLYPQYASPELKRVRSFTSRGAARKALS